MAGLSQDVQDLSAFDLCFISRMIDNDMSKEDHFSICVECDHLSRELQKMVGLSQDVQD